MSGNDSRRSQAQAACNSCRKRKSRCKFDDTDQTVCLMCKLHGSECIFPESSAESSRSSPAVRRAHKLSARQNAAASASPGPSRIGPDRAPSTHSTRRMSSTPDVSQEVAVVPALPPVRTGDAAIRADIAEQRQRFAAGLSANYMSHNGGVRSEDNHELVPHSRLSGWCRGFAPGQRPILWNSLRRLPLGSAPSATKVQEKCTLITRFIEPYREEIIDAYFSTVHRSFPLLSEKSFCEQYNKDRNKISPALLSSLYSNGIVYWRRQKYDLWEGTRESYLPLTLRELHHPDLRTIWDQADMALTSESHAPSGVSTIIAILLRISGRPFTTMVRSKQLLSDAVVYAHMLSLDRNSTDWDISTEESRMRTRLWWAIVINDRWLSVTFGTPPLLKASQHDVPKPGSLPVNHNEDEISPTFAALASLCDVIDTYLEYVFDFHNATGDGNADIGRVIERQLSLWKDALPYDLRSEVIDLYPPETSLSTPGSANLRLAYLYITFLARKLGFNTMKQNSRTGVDRTLLDYHRQHAVSAAEKIVDFVQDLESNDRALKDFYLPFTAFCMSDTVAFLIRLALYSSDRSDLQRRCLNLASDMIESLKRYRRDLEWDLGDICLVRHAHIVEAMATSSGDQQWEDIPGLEEIRLSDFPEVDQMAPELWDMYNGVSRV